MIRHILQCKNFIIFICTLPWQHPKQMVREVNGFSYPDVRINIHFFLTCRYDNEYGYSCRVIDLLKHMSKVDSA